MFTIAPPRAIGSRLGGDILSCSSHAIGTGRALPTFQPCRLLIRGPPGSIGVLPFQAKPSASTATRCIRPFHSRPSTVPGLTFEMRRPKSTARCPAFSGDPEPSSRR
jgi:hypothetical protein